MISLRNTLYRGVTQETARIFQSHRNDGNKSSLRRMSSNSNDQQERQLPFLMNFSVKPSPNFVHSFKNFIFTNAIIGPYYDNDFTKENFLEGAKSAVEFVSNKIAEGDFDKLRESNVLTDDCFRDIVLNSSKFSNDQRHLIALSKNDIMYDFVYQIGVMLDDDRNTRHVEITYTAHYIPEKDAATNEEMQDFSDFQRSILVLTYRFIRNYTKGVEDSWTINALNHVSMKDVTDGHRF